MNLAFEKNMLFKFLTRNFPVSRIKHNGRFRRAIVFDDGEVYLCSDPKAMNELKHKLVDILKKTFILDESICRIVLDNFLQIGE
jgi:hypothetical protein